MNIRGKSWTRKISKGHKPEKLGRPFQLKRNVHMLRKEHKLESEAGDARNMPETEEKGERKEGTNSGSTLRFHINLTTTEIISALP